MSAEGHLTVIADRHLARVRPADRTGRCSGGRHAGDTEYGWLRMAAKKNKKENENISILFSNSISQRVFITEVGSSPPDGRKIIPVTEGDLRKWHKNKSAHYKRHHGKVV